VLWLDDDRVALCPRPAVCIEDAGADLDDFGGVAEWRVTGPTGGLYVDNVDVPLGPFHGRNRTPIVVGLDFISVVRVCQSVGMDEALQGIEADAAALLRRPVWAAGDGDLADALIRVSRVVTQLTAFSATVAHELGGRGWAGRHGATSMPVWMRDHLRLSVYEAKRLTELGAQLAAREAMATALAAGAVSPEQARVIADALADLPSDLDADLVEECEAALIAHAATLEPKALRTAGVRILAHVAPEVADAALLDKLHRDEERARRIRAFTMTPDGRGAYRLSGSLDTESAAIVRAAIDPLCRPIPGPGSSPGERQQGERQQGERQRDERQRDVRLPSQRRADALVEVCRLAMATDRLPNAGGQRPQVAVTADFDTLTKQLSVGRFDNGDLVTPATVRRLACDAGIIPAVLASTSEVLDLGRTMRLFNVPQRRALELRDRGCAFPHCDRPPRWCEAHHMRSWLEGGDTDLDNGVLLCAHHHRIIHHSDWQVRLGPDRRPEFVPPAYLDPLQRSQRNRYHERP